MARARITNAQLETFLRSVNEGRGKETRKDLGYVYLDSAYGGARVVEIVNEHGGVRVLSDFGYGTKRECYNFLVGMAAGIAAGRQDNSIRMTRVR